MKIKQPEMKRGYSPQELCSVWGLNQGTLANLRSQRRGPRYYRVGRKIIYFFEDIESWLRRDPVITKDSLPDNSSSFSRGE